MSIHRIPDRQTTEGHIYCRTHSIERLTRSGKNR